MQTCHTSARICFTCVRDRLWFLVAILLAFVWRCLAHVKSLHSYVNLFYIGTDMFYSCVRKRIALVCDTSEHLFGHFLFHCLFHLCVVPPVLCMSVCSLWSNICRTFVRASVRAQSFACVCEIACKICSMQMRWCFERVLTEHKMQTRFGQM